MAEWANWQHGGVRYPLTADTTNSLLQDADPSLFVAIQFFSAVLDFDIGPRLKAQADLEGLKINHAVAQTLHLEPSPDLFNNQFVFPTLALYRKTETTLQHTVEWDKDVGNWEFAYLLPALTPRQQEKIAPILRSVVRSIAHWAAWGWHPRYQGGARIWASTSIQKMRLLEATYGKYEGIGENAAYWRAVMGQLEVTERDMPVNDAFPSFNGADVGIDLAQPNTAPLLDVVEVSTEPAPTILSVVPNTGTSKGGTPITIFGTNFRAPISLALGGIEVEAEIVDTSTLIATTPPHAAYPIYMADIVVKNGDGQLARGPAAFTYTAP